MISPKKLSVIRQELERAMSAGGGDPIAWLEKRMSAPKAKAGGAVRESEIMQSLQRFLNVAREPQKRRRKQDKTARR